MPNLTITAVAERPELAGRMYEIRDSWPEFMGHDKLANALLNQVSLVFPEYCVVATTDDNTLVARGRSIPFDAERAGRELFPDGGWDTVLQWGFADQRKGHRPTVACALDIVVDTAYLGQGLSHQMLGALRVAVAAQGHEALIAPVRPNAKHLQPGVPVKQYLADIRPDGLPADPWLRVHVRAGGTVIKPAPASMVIAGSLAQWREWTGLPFDHEGDIDVPGALVPVHCDLVHGYAVYVEPNVWVRHDL
nr:hypothetical protein [Phytoactinopolyspora mesophila]